jgi:Domain of unknown function (DUF4136)
MKRRMWVLLLVVLLLGGGCAAVDVRYDFDRSADFSAYRTYAWKDAEVSQDALAANPLLQKRVKAAVEQHLSKRGFLRINDKYEPDIYLAVHAGVKERMRVTDWGGPHGYYRNPWYRPWWGGGMYGSRIDVRYYTEGTLIIDVIDAQKRDLIWRGVGTGIVQRYDNEEEMQRMIDEYVVTILLHFPPDRRERATP